MTASAQSASPQSPGRIVLTGAAGFLGSHLAERFLDEGYEVVGVDNFITGSRDNIALLQEREAFDFMLHDVSTPLFLAGPVHGVLHFASPASPVDYLEYPIQTLKVGSLGTHNMLGLARQKRARFLLASTSEVYGDPAIHPQPESYWGNVNPVGPRGVYDEAKRFAEAMTSAYRTHHGLETRIVRIFNTYGPRMRPGDGRVVSNFIVQAIRGEPLTLYGDGSQTRSFCYVSDLVEGIFQLFLSDHPGPMNLGNPNEFTVRELAEEILRAVGRPDGGDAESAAEPESSSSTAPPGTRSLPLPEDDPKVRQPDITLARGELGWEPRVGLQEGLARTIPWFRTQVEGFDARARPLA